MTSTIRAVGREVAVGTRLFTVIVAFGASSTMLHATRPKRAKYMIATTRETRARAGLLFKRAAQAIGLILFSVVTSPKVVQLSL